jgi:NADH-quinone oxidoreductase subunit N
MTIDFLAVAPLVIIVGAVVVLLMVDVQWPLGHRWWALTAALGLGGATAASAVQWAERRGVGAGTAFEGMIVVDGFSAFAGLVVFPVAGLGLMAAWPLVRSLPRRGAEFVTLALIAAAGAHLMAASANLIVLFISLEIFSISLYILAGFTRARADADEAALKYFLLGALASALFVYGVALVFAATGTTSIYGIAAYLESTIILRPGVLLAGVALVLVGLAFKVSAVPFHAWAPDVYQGAPGGVTGFLAATAKVAGFAALARVLTTAFEVRMGEWVPAVAVIAAASMVVGTLLALVQADIKRMLAYSSVAHAGFILTALVAGGAGIEAMWFYLATYAVAVVAAFAVVAVVTGPGEGRAALTDFAGLSERSPLLAGGLGLALLSMGGIPLTAGFVGKVAVFRAAVDAGYLWLVILGLVAAVAGLFFYLRVIVLMYMQPASDTGEETPGRPTVPAAPTAVVIAAAAVTVALGVAPWPLLNWLRDALPL